MAGDGTRVYEPPAGATTPAVDTDDITYPDTSVRVRQIFELGGTASGDIAAVYARADGVKSLATADDCTTFEAQHVTLVASTDTTITFTQPVRIVRVLNWDTVNRVLIKDGAIASDTSATATRVGKAPAADVPASRTLPFLTTTIHLRSAAASEVTVEGYI